MIKAVIFDIDNTIYNYDVANKYAMTKLYDYCLKNLDIKKEEFDKHIKMAKDLVNVRLQGACSAMHNRLIRFQVLLEILKKPLFPHAFEMEKCYWNALICYAKQEDGIEHFMKELKKNKICVGIGTNMTANWQFVKLQELNLGKYIDFIVTSEEANTQKPDKRFFDLCIQKSGVKPYECLFIGDSLKNDVLGAKNANMKAILYTGCMKEKQFTKLKDLDIVFINSFHDAMIMIDKV